MTMMDTASYMKDICFMKNQQLQVMLMSVIEWWEIFMKQFYKKMKINEHWKFNALCFMSFYMYIYFFSISGLVHSQPK